MYERNNEASKRCRLKRRIKAVLMENQSSMLSMANKMLKLRIMRLENVGAALKEGVKKIQVRHWIFFTPSFKGHQHFPITLLLILTFYWPLITLRIGFPSKQLSFCV